MASETESSPPEVFFCYKSEDQERVAEVRRALESQEVSVWQDKTGVYGGQSWREKAGPAIRDCKVVLLMCTDRSMNSPEVQSEVELSRKHHKGLIPLRIEKDLIIPDAMELLLIRLQYIEIMDRRSEEWLPDLLTALEQFGVSFRRLPPPAPPPELLETLTWLQQLRNFADGLRQYAADASDRNEEETKLKQRTAAAVDYLIAVEKKLPRLQRTLVALAQHKQVPKEEVAALFQLQSALLDVARAAMHFQLDRPQGLEELLIPPYDAWLPFKDGLGKPSQQSTFR